MSAIRFEIDARNAAASCEWGITRFVAFTLLADATTRTDFATTATMLRIRFGINAYTAARACRTRTSTRAVGADLVRSASFSAPTAMTGIGLEADAQATTERLPCGAGLFADPCTTDLARSTGFCASTAMVGVGLQADALSVAVGLWRGAIGGTLAGSVGTGLAFGAGFTASTAVGEIDERVDAVSAAVLFGRLAVRSALA